MAKDKKPTAKEIKMWKEKAKKWDALDEKVSKFYGAEEGEKEPEGDLGTIGEIAAMALGYL